MTEKPSDSPPKKNKRLTKKQAALVRARIKRPEATLSALGQKVGYSDAAHTQRALSLPHVQDRMRALMSLRPTTSLPGLLTKLEEGLDATFVKVFKADDDSIIESKEYVDQNARAKFLGIASGWMGLEERRVHLSMDSAPPMTLAEARRIVAHSPKVIDAEAE